MPKNIGELIKEALERMGYTQVQLARELGVTPPTVNNWISGRTYPSGVNRTELERVLGPLRPQSEVAQWLRRERDGARLTQNDLALKAKVAPVTISNIERGETTPQDGTIAKLANALGVSAPDDGESDCQGDNTPIIEVSDQNNPLNMIEDMEDFPPHDEERIKQILDNVGGIYVLLDQNGNAVYVGQSSNIAQRITARNGHSEQKWYNRRTIISAKYIRIENDVIRRKIETILIKLLRPQINKQHSEPDKRSYRK